MAINLGDINFGLGPDTSRLDAARQAILNFGQAVNRAARSQADGARAAESAMRRQEKAILSALQTTLNLNKAIRDVGGGSNLLNTTTNTFNRLTKELTRGQVSALAFQRAMEDFQASTGRVRRSIAQLRNEVAETKSIQEKQAADATRLLLKQERAYHSAELAVLRYNAAVEKLKPAQRDLFAGGADRALTQLRSGIAGAGADPLAFQRAQQQFSKSMAIMNRDLSAFTTKAKNAAFTHFEVALRRLSDVAILLHGPLGGIAARLSLISHVAESVSFKMAALVTAISAVAFAMSQLAVGSIQTAKVFDRIDQSLISLTGSQEQAAAHFDFISKVAERAGAQVDDLSRMYVRLVAASRGTNLEGEKTRRIFENITVAGQKLGLTNEELAGTLRAVEQIMSKGQVQAEELRGQLGDRLPGAVNIMAESLGVSTAELNKMMKQGKITSDALLAFSEVLVKRLGIEGTDAINTIGAAENRLYNQFLLLKKEIATTTGIAATYTSALNTLASAFQWLTANMGQAISVLIGVGASVATALAFIYGPGVIAGFAALVSMIWGAVTATGAFSAALVVLRGALIKTGIGALIVLVGVLVYWVSETIRKVGSLGETFQLVKDVAAEAFGKVVDTFEWVAEMASWASNRLSFMFLTAIANILQAFQDMTWKIAEGFNALFGTSLSGVNFEGVISGLGDTADAAWANAAESAAAMESLAKSINAPMKSIAALKKAMEEGTKEPVIPGITDPEGGTGSGTGSGTGGGRGGSRAANAIRDASQAIKELQVELEILALPKHQQEWARRQLEVNKKIDDFRDKLIEAKVPQQQIVTLTKQYADNLRLLEETKVYLETHVTLWETVSNAIMTGLDNAGQAFAKMALEGKFSMESLRDVARNVVNDILQSFIQLAWINPLKNALFGGNPATGLPFPTFGGYMAEGGPLQRGKWYIAGENGPEPIWGGGNGAFAFANAGQMSSFAGKSFGSGSSGVGSGMLDGRIELVARIDKDGNWKAEVERISGGIAQHVSVRTVQEYDSVLPDRVQSINNKPWRKG